MGIVVLDRKTFETLLAALLWADAMARHLEQLSDMVTEFMPGDDADDAKEG
jgi:hypothetical protein